MDSLSKGSKSMEKSVSYKIFPQTSLNCQSSICRTWPADGGGHSIKQTIWKMPEKHLTVAKILQHLPVDNYLNTLPCHKPIFVKLHVRRRFSVKNKHIMTFALLTLGNLLSVLSFYVNNRVEISTFLDVAPLMCVCPFSPCYCKKGLWKQSDELGILNFTV